MSEPETLTRSERIRALNDWIEGTNAQSLIEALALLCEQLEAMSVESRRGVLGLQGAVREVKLAANEVKGEVRRVARISQPDRLPRA